MPREGGAPSNRQRTRIYANRSGGDYWIARPSRAMTRTRDRAMTGFPDKAVMAELTAKMLLEVDAVRFMTDKPFIYTSSWASPVYTDCRRLISFPRVRKALIDFGVTTLQRDAGFEQFDS